MLQKFNKKNRDLIININGALLHRDDAGISPFDSAVQGGDAVWEGLRVYDGKIFRLRAHLDRLRSSALALDFKQIPTHESITEEIKRTLEANRMRDKVPSPNSNNHLPTIFLAIKPMSNIPSKGTVNPNERLIKSCNSGLRVINGCLLYTSPSPRDS